MDLGFFSRYAANTGDRYLGTCFSRPNYIGLIITEKCNFKCVHCDVWQKNDAVRIDESEWLKILSDIKKLGGRQVIEINGGEPLIEKDLVYVIAREGSRLGLEMSVNTNGSLIDENVASELCSSGLKSVKISLYSVDENVHDQLRGIAGAGKKAKEALRLLKEKNEDGRLKIEIGALVTKKNIDGLGRLLDYARQNDFILILQPLDFVLERSYAENWQSGSELWPSKEQVEKFLAPLARNKPANLKNPRFYLKAICRYYSDPDYLKKRECLAPYNNLVIWPSGDVSLCFRANTIGNATQESLAKIWRSGRAKEERQRLRWCEKSCKMTGCNIKKQIRDFLT